jgi:predicted ATPase/DNA-binding XRE family transcriptional regulator
VSHYTFGQWLKWRREALNLTQKTLAQTIGCSEITIRKLESDERHPSPEIADLIAKQLLVSAERRTQFLSFARSGQPSLHPLIYWTTSSRPLTNLTPAPTPFFGRDEQMTVLGDKFRREAVRLLTLVGPPGIGKTRLSIEVGWRLLDEFQDGVYFVPLDQIESADLIPSAIMSALGISHNNTQPTYETIRRYLQDCHVLLVLDNFEHVVEAAPRVADLLAACPYLRVLATSRAILRVRHEHQFRVPPLPLDSAVTLFAERAHAASGDFELTADNQTAVTDLCTRLDGLPLAIELTAAYIRLLSPQELAQQLDGRRLLQTPAPVDVPERHQTLEVAINGSYNLLERPLQRLLAQLSVFVGGWTLEAAQAVCGQPELDVLPGLMALLDRSLIQQEKVASGQTRYKMLVPLREYAAQRLADAGLHDETRDKHSLYFAELAKTSRRQLQDSSQPQWVSQLAAEHGNLRTALDWSEQHPALVEQFLRMAGMLEWYWVFSARSEEGLNYLRRGLARNDAVCQPVVRAHALQTAIRLAMYCDQLEYANAIAEEPFKIFTALGDKKRMANTLFEMGYLYYTHRNYDQCLNLYRQSLALAQEMEDTWMLASAHMMLSNFFLSAPNHRDIELACEHGETGLALARSQSNDFMMSLLQIVLGYIYIRQDKLPSAEALFEESLHLTQQLKNRRNMGAALHGLGKVALYQGELPRAQSLYIEGLQIWQEIQDKSGMIECLYGLAEVFESLGKLSAAVQLLAIVEPHIESLLIVPIDPAECQQHIEDLRAQLSEKQFAFAWAQGQALRWEQVSVKTVLHMA